MWHADASNALFMDLGDTALAVSPTARTASCVRRACSEGLPVMLFMVPVGQQLWYWATGLGSRGGRLQSVIGLAQWALVLNFAIFYCTYACDFWAATERHWSRTVGFGTQFRNLLLHLRLRFLGGYRASLVSHSGLWYSISQSFIAPTPAISGWCLSRADGLYVLFRLMYFGWRHGCYGALVRTLAQEMAVHADSFFKRGTSTKTCAPSGSTATSKK